MDKFKLWLEFEEVDPDKWQKDNDFCNIHVTMEDGRHYGINVWTYNFLTVALQSNKQARNNLNGLYLIPPDLFVEELTRDCIEKTISDLLKIGNLEEVLNPSVISKNTD
ncbi:hypothetical protein [Flavobacterium nitrogenifigens]|uniref:Uncharacterized protein n=1 Tax=Flavobacterium nitrogenifigens TaxID=1617283 RepID=A0A521AIK2_9FLAO|nr:hypothetical protein [Flavobacterium nitrogenifigens]KAF2331577.1 hypothetical protein DM397_12645 [Flavobacterium nitrogenifigens]SMO34646.1 hypothetical protein SAMN06265220_101182 [Flavobacterium nitrogenifigens]